VAFLAPSWPRTGWGWLLSAALGLPLLLLAEVIFTLCFAVGPPRYRRYRLADRLFEVPAGTPGARVVLLLVRIVAGIALCALVLWLLHLLLGIGVVRAQFR
jgi:ABC-type multidrug transport system permease subunit